MANYGLNRFRFYRNSSEIYRVIFIFKMIAVAFVFWELHVLYTYPYSKKVRVSGEVVGASLQAPIMSPASGVVVERKAQVKDQVKSGEVLYVISPPTAFRDGLSAILQSAQSQFKAAAESLERTENFMAQAADAYRKERSNLTKLLESSKSQLLIEMNKAQLSAARLSAVENARDAYSPGEVDRFRHAYLESQGAAKRIELSIAEIETRMGALDAAYAREIRDQSIRAESMRTELERRRADVFEKEQTQTVLVKAPASGEFLASHVEAGYIVEQGETLGTLMLSEGFNPSPLIKLAIDPEKVRYVDRGVKVVFELPAYPVKQFGYFEGEVSGVTRPVSRDGPTYIDVMPTDARIIRDSRDIRLEPGMKVNANLIVERLTLFQWFFESVYLAVKFKDVVR